MVALFRWSMPYTEAGRAMKLMERMTVELIKARKESGQAVRSTLILSQMPKQAGFEFPPPSPRTSCN